MNKIFLGFYTASTKRGQLLQEPRIRNVDVKWLHENQYNLIRLVSEIGLDGYEIRKLEFFRDGRCVFACEFGATLGVELGSAPTRTLDNINAIVEFEGVEISEADFDAFWVTVVR